MPFLPLPDTGREKAQLSDIGLLVIRIMVVATFCYYQHFDQLTHAQDLIWESGEWNLVEQLEENGFPFPDLVAVTSIVVLSLSLLGVVIGIFTRVNALIAALMTGFALLAPLVISTTLNPQALALYIAVFAGLAVGGGGRLSLDYSLADRRAKRKESI